MSFQRPVTAPGSGGVQTLDIIGNKVATFEKVLSLRREIYGLRNVSGKLVKRVLPCGNYPAVAATQITASRGVSGGTFYANLQTCKSVWCCPVCSLKIASARSAEVADIVRVALERGYKALFITLTLPHFIGQSAKMLKTNVALAFKKMTTHRNFKKLTASGLGVDLSVRERTYFFDEKKQGRTYFEKSFDTQKVLARKPAFIRALEITHTYNGWHPHLHVLFFYSGSWEENGAKIGAEIVKLWVSTCKLQGFDCNFDAQSVKRVDDARGVSEYISKWDLSKELTEGHTKKSSNTPFVLLKRYKETKDEKYATLFREFALAFNGARQLTYSRGLKMAFLELPEKTDEEIVRDEKIDEILFGIAFPVWKQIKKNGVEADLLTAYDRGGMDGVCTVLDNLPNFDYDLIFISGSPFLKHQQHAT